VCVCDRKEERGIYVLCMQICRSDYRIAYFSFVRFVWGLDVAQQSMRRVWAWIGRVRSCGSMQDVI
jgi:hypothetical protein